MDKIRNQQMPRARQDELVIRELADEVLVYDLKHQRAHCLNKTAALVWQRCDGKTSITQIAMLVGDKLEIEVDENVVWLALGQLDKAHLLGESLPRPADNFSSTRRELMRKLGWSAAAALPLITSVLAPTAVAAASPCTPKGAPCTTTAECCVACTCGGNPPKCQGGC